MRCRWRHNCSLTDMVMQAVLSCHLCCHAASFRAVAATAKAATTLATAFVPTLLFVLQDFLRLARESVLAESSALQQQLAALDEDAASVQRCLDAVSTHAPARLDSPAAQAAVAEQAARLSYPAASSQHPAADAPATAGGSNGAASGSRKRSRGGDGQTAAPAATEAAADGAAPDAAEGTVPDGSAGSPGGKARRVAAALHAVEAAFFRARSAIHRDVADRDGAASEEVDSPTTLKRKVRIKYAGKPPSGSATLHGHSLCSVQSLAAVSQRIKASC